jgi:hypothetical protein
VASMHGLIATPLARAPASLLALALPQNIVKQPGFQTYEDFHTYVIDWQPGYIRWYIDGRLLLERLAKDWPAMPAKPQAWTMSLWTKTNPKLADWTTQTDNWGGVFDPKHEEPYESFVTNSRRVLCDLPLPQTMTMGVERVPVTFEMPAPQAEPVTEGTPILLAPAPKRSPPPGPPPSPEPEVVGEEEEDQVEPAAEVEQPKLQEAAKVEILLPLRKEEAATASSTAATAAQAAVPSGGVSSSGSVSSSSGSSAGPTAAVVVSAGATAQGSKATAGGSLDVIDPMADGLRAPPPRGNEQGNSAAGHCPALLTLLLGVAYAVCMLAVV